jgi:site-specific DNA-adenine methylase
MRKHDIVFTCQDASECLDLLPPDTFVVLDPPYIAHILKYRLDDFDISKLVECIEKLNKFQHWILYNDAIAPYLAALQNVQNIHYIVKNGGISPTARVEYVFYKL